MADEYDLGDLAGTLFGAGSDQFGVGGFDMSGFGDMASKAAPNVGWWDSFGSLAKAALPWAQVGAAGANIGLGIQGATQLASQTKIAQDTAKRQSKIGSEAADFGRNEIARAEAGQVPPAVQAQIDQWTQGAKQQAMDQAARTGQGDSTQLKQWLAWIDQQAQAMKASYLGQEETMGLNAYQIGMGGGGGGGAAGQQGSLESLIAASNQVLSRLSQGAT